MNIFIKKVLLANKQHESIIIFYIENCHFIQLCGYGRRVKKTVTLKQTLESDKRKKKKRRKNLWRINLKWGKYMYGRGKGKWLKMEREKGMFEETAHQNEKKGEFQWIELSLEIKLKATGMMLLLVSNSNQIWSEILNEGGSPTNQTKKNYPSSNPTVHIYITRNWRPSVAPCIHVFHNSTPKQSMNQ